MSENIKFEKQVFSKDQYEKVIDTSFKQIDQAPTVEVLAETPSVNDFFSLYNELFYDIPEKGTTNSHEFLIKQSSEYINFEEDNEEIEALREEIASLRTELLETQKQLIEAETGVNVDELPNNTSPNTTTSTSGGSITGGSSGGSGGGY